MPPSGASTILLSVVGQSPQVITETLYCLLVQRKPPTDVREVHALTTQVGAQQVRAKLLHPRDGWFHRFCREYGIPARRIRFDASHIRVPVGGDGKPLEDVRTSDDNLRVADAVLERVRELTRDPAVALHVSVAGGRKTMGLLLGIAFQLFARPQDRLSHVLVAPAELESHPEFYYPPPARASYRLKDGRRVESRDVRVELAEIPMLLLRGKVQAGEMERLSYSDLIARGQTELDRLAAPPPMALVPRGRTLQIGSESVTLTALEFALYSLFARRRVDGCGKPGCAGCDRCGIPATDCHDPSLREQLVGVLKTLGVRDERALALTGWRATRDSDPQERFLQTRSRINRRIREALGAGQWVDRYLIAAGGKRGDTIYYLPVAPELIHLV